MISFYDYFVFLLTFYILRAELELFMNGEIQKDKVLLYDFMTQFK